MRAAKPDVSGLVVPSSSFEAAVDDILFEARRRLLEAQVCGCADIVWPSGDSRFEDNVVEPKMSLPKPGLGLAMLSAPCRPTEAHEREDEPELRVMPSEQVTSDSLPAIVGGGPVGAGNVMFKLEGQEEPMVAQQQREAASERRQEAQMSNGVRYAPRFSLSETPSSQSRRHTMELSTAEDNVLGIMSSAGCSERSDGSCCSSAVRTPTSKLKSIIEAANEGGVLRKRNLNMARTFTSATMADRRIRCGLAADTIVGAVIFVNACTIGMSLDLNPDWPGWRGSDAAFALIYMVEILAKVRALGIREFALGESKYWHAYDVAMLLFAFVELGMIAAVAISPHAVANDTQTRNVFGAFRVVRLARVARLLRVIRLAFFSELLMMINGAIGGLRTLLWSQLLLAVPLYCFAVMLREVLGAMSHMENGAELFGSLTTSFFTCYRCLVAGDCSMSDGRPVVLAVSSTYGWGFSLCYMLASAFMTFGLFNVIASIFVDNILEAAKFNELRQKQERLTNQKMFAEKALSLVDLIVREQEKQGLLPPEIDPEVIGTAALHEMDDLLRIQLTPDFFEELRSLNEFQEILRDLDISDEEQLDLFDTLDVDGGGTIDLEELIQGVAKLRGDARRSDIVSVALMVRNLQAGLDSLERSTKRQYKAQREALRIIASQRDIMTSLPPSQFRSEHTSSAEGTW